MKRATIVLTLLLSAVGVLAGPAVAADATPTATERLQSLDREILHRLNAARVSRGLRRLTVSSNLDAAAVAHSRSMLQGGFFAHDSRDGSPFVARVKRYYPASGFSSWSAGENLLYNTAAIEAEAAIAAWLASPAHRENMLEPGWREVGIASLHTPSAGGQFGGEPTWVITMDFGARTGSARIEKQATKPLARPAAKPKTVKAAKARKPKQAAQARKAQKPARPEQPEQRPVDRALPRPSGSGQPDASFGSDDQADEPAADEPAADEPAADQQSDDSGDGQSDQGENPEGEDPGDDLLLGP